MKAGIVISLVRSRLTWLFCLLHTPFIPKSTYHFKPILTRMQAKFIMDSFLVYLKSEMYWVRFVQTTWKNNRHACSTLFIKTHFTLQFMYISDQTDNIFWETTRLYEKLVLITGIFMFKKFIAKSQYFTGSITRLELIAGRVGTDTSETYLSAEG